MYLYIPSYTALLNKRKQHWIKRCLVALVFRAVRAEQNSTSTRDLVPTLQLAALNKCTNYECETRSWA